MKISNAFKRTTKKGHVVYRIMVDTNEILSNLEQNKTVIGVDIMTNNGLVKTISGKSKKGYSWEALTYYVWSKTKDPVKEVVVNAVPN